MNIAGDFDGTGADLLPVWIEVERHGELEDADDGGKPKDAAPTEGFSQSAAKEVGESTAAGPNDIVDADDAGKFRGVDMIAGECFEVWPGKAHPEGPDAHGNHERRDAGEKRAHAESSDHNGCAEGEGVYVAVLLPVLTAEQSARNEDGTIERADEQILEIGEGVFAFEEKEEVIEVKRGGERV